MVAKAVDIIRGIVGGMEAGMEVGIVVVGKAVDKAVDKALVGRDGRREIMRWSPSGRQGD
jgi:hypothetical protein